jgi:hypothetical protein
MDNIMDSIKMQAGVSVGGMALNTINQQTGSHVDIGPTMNAMNMLPMINVTMGKGVILQTMNTMGKKTKRKHK